MKVVADKKRFIKGFKYGTQNNAQFIPIEDIVYFRQADISSLVLGVGETAKVTTAIDLSNSMNDHEVNLIQRGGTPETTLVLPPDQVVSSDEIKRMKLDYKRNYRGTKNAGKMMILSGGGKLETVGFSPKEMAYLGGRKWSREEIVTGGYGVPITFFDMPAVSRANAATANIEYQRRTIKPKLIETEDVLNEQLVSDFDENLFVAFDENVPEDRDFRLKEKQTNITIGYSTVNEERMRDGLDPIEGGDELRSQTDTEPAQTVTEPVKRVKAIPPLEMPAANFIPEDFVNDLQKYFKVFGNAILAQATPDAFKSRKVANPDDLVSRWFDFTVWDKRLQDTVSPHIRASILLAGPRALKSVLPGAEFDESSPGVANVLTQRNVVIRNMNRTVQKDTRAAIAAGIDRGENATQLRKRIEGVFGFEDRVRSTRIARTETIWGLNAGAIEGYKQSGVVVAKEWSTAADERVCEWCEPMDGKIIGLEGDYFKMGDTFIGRDGGKLNFQIENVGHPPLHPQCRCAIVPMVRT
jgi:HK97 family phage portal protein